MLYLWIMIQEYIGIGLAVYSFMMKNIYQVFFNNSPKMGKVKAIIDEIAKTDITVLIKGESGTGKELVAQAIHLNSPRNNKPFIKVNCAAIPKSLIESELFGFEKGAFTGAHLKKPGKFELANGGTIMLNEIGAMDISIQAKLLQVLQDNEFSRLGGETDIHIDTRMITTTQDHLEKSVIEGRFREDLYYRINVMSITIPPLRDRREQITPFCHYYFHLYEKKYQKSIPFLSSQAINVFKKYDWPGNMRELENAIKRIILLGEKVVLQDLVENQAKSPKVHPTGPFGADTEQRIELPDLKQVAREAAAIAEKGAIHKTLQETHWNRKEAAKILQVSYKALLYKIQKYRLDDSKTFPKD
jgi:two-component system, NtrC family, response regulator AtoC